MKILGLVFLLLTVYACRPHYDFSKERAELKADAKSDSLVYQTGFTAMDAGWYDKKTGTGTLLIENDNAVIRIDTVNRSVQTTAPCGFIRYDYSILIKTKMMVEDSTDLGYTGLFFDRIDTNYYRTLFISNKGTFYLKDVCNGVEELLIPKIPSRYLNKSHTATNTIEIRHRKKEIHILFNGNLAAICKLKGAFSYGELGLAAATTENKVHYSPVKALFEAFVLKKIKAE